MAIIELGNTKIANRLISYAEKRSVVTEGINCLPMAAKYQFSATRGIFGKNDGIQAHHVIQSFSPGEVTAEQANTIGVELTNKLAPGYECVVYTHIDKAHIHNHIVINSVEFENGKKFHLHGQDGIDKTRAISDELCQIHGLSVIEKETAKERHTMAEKGLRLREEKPWKDTIREAVQHELSNSTDYDNFKQNMQDNHGITINERGQTVTYRMEGMGRAVRGRKLGMDYELNTISNIRAAIEKERERFETMKAEASKAARDLGQVNRKLYGQKENYEKNIPILTELENQIAEKSADLETIVERYKFFSERKSNLMDEVMSYVKKKNSLKLEIGEASAALQTLNEEKSHISSNLEELRYKESTITDQIEELIIDKQNLTVKNVELLDKQTSLQTDISSIDQILNKKYLEIEAHTNKLNALRHEEAATAKNLQDLKNEFNDFDNDFNDFIEKAQDTISKYKNNIDLIEELNEKSEQRKNDICKLVLKPDPDLKEIERLSNSINDLYESYKILKDDRDQIENTIVETKVSWKEKVDHLDKIRDREMAKKLEKGTLESNYYNLRAKDISPEKLKEIENIKPIVAKRYETKLDPIEKSNLPEIEKNHQIAIEKKNELDKLAEKHDKPIYTVKATAARLKNACEKHFGNNFATYQPIDGNTGTVSFYDEHRQLQQREVFFESDRIKLRDKREIIQEPVSSMNLVNQLNVIVPDIKNLLKEKSDMRVLIEKTKEYYGENQFMFYDPIEDDKAVITRLEGNRILRHNVWIENNSIIADKPNDITLQWKQEVAEAEEAENDWDMDR